MSDFVAAPRRNAEVAVVRYLAWLVALGWSLAVFFLIVLPHSSVHAQGTSNHPGQLNVSIQTTPGAIPTSMTPIYTGDAYVCEMDITATGQTITVQDQQAVAVVWINNVLGSTGLPTTWIYTSPDSTCRHFPNGVSWQASAGGATGYAIIKHN